MLLGSRRDRMALTREPIPAPGADAPLTFICPACDVVLWDGVAYASCPACDLPVDWVDVSIPVWCCPNCDLMINQHRDDHPRCETCDMALVRVFALEHPPADETPATRTPPGRLRRLWHEVLEVVVPAFVLVLVLLGLCGPLLSLALDPQWRLLALGLAAPLLFVPITMAGIFLWSLGKSLRELRDLARDRTTRVIHGLEHAAAKLLVAEGNVVHGGLTHDGFFELYMEPEGKAQHQAAKVRDAVKRAIRRIRAGERHLAYHPKCGTSMLVTVALLALMALSAAVIGLLVDLRPRTLVVIGGVFVGIILVAARPLGLLTQLLLTVSTSFRSARVLRVVLGLERAGEIACYAVYFNVRL